MIPCQNPGAHRHGPVPAVGMFRCLTVQEPRDLCAECVESLNALGMDWHRIPVWLERGIRGLGAKDLTGRVAA